MAKQHLAVYSRRSLTTHYDANTGLRRFLNETFALLRHYAESIGIYLQTFQDNLLVSSSRGIQSSLTA
jgi:hypothetical protein